MAILEAFQFNLQIAVRSSSALSPATPNLTRWLHATKSPVYLLDVFASNLAMYNFVIRPLFFLPSLDTNYVSNQSKMPKKTCATTSTYALMQSKKVRWLPNQQSVSKAATCMPRRSVFRANSMLFFLPVNSFRSLVLCTPYFAFGTFRQSNCQIIYLYTQLSAAGRASMLCVTRSRRMVALLTKLFHK